MNVLVCGSRNGYDPVVVNRTLDIICAVSADPVTIIHGGAPGVDKQAEEFAQRAGIDTNVFPAKWDVFGKAAGPIRNQQMLAVGPQFLVAFKRNYRSTNTHGGTEHMVKLAKAAGIKIWVFR